MATPQQKRALRTMLLKKSFGANVRDSLPPFEQPYVENFEGDTVGETGAQLSAKITHNNVFVDPLTVQLVGYSTMPEIVGTDLTKCVTCPGNQVVGSTILLPGGYGYIPSGGAVVLAETVAYCTGTSAQVEIWMRDAAQGDGVLAYHDGNNFKLNTIRNSVQTAKLSVSDNLASSPFQTAWFYMALQYNLSNNQVYMRIIEFGASATEDSGWVSLGTVVSPTFNNNEWVTFQVISKSDTTGLVGVSQLRVTDAQVGGYGLGQLATHNYQDLT